MKKIKISKKQVIFVSILLLSLGFAAVTTTLLLHGNVNVGSNENVFEGNVIFTRAYTNSGTSSISEDGKSITFTTKELSKLNEESKLEYDITNRNREYDATATINCNTESREFKNYVAVTANETKYELPAGETASGSLIAKLIKVYNGEVPVETTFTCIIDVTAEERDSLAEEKTPIFTETRMLKEVPVKELERCEYNDRLDVEECEFYYEGLDLWKYRESTTKIVFENKMNVRTTDSNFVEDVSENKDGSVMAYFVENKEMPSTYTLYVQGENGVVANPNSVSLFQGFSQLKEIEGLEYLDTSKVVNMERMFYECKNITDLDLSTFDTGQATNMKNMFYNCWNLATLNLGQFNTSNVKDMSYMFSWCKRLTSLNISLFNTSNVINMERMFQYCESIKELDLSHFNVKSVENLSWIFAFCNSLTTLKLDNWNPENATLMGKMFYYCESLIGLDLSSFTLSKAQSIESMFFGCKSLMSLDISNMSFGSILSSGLLHLVPNEVTIIVKSEAMKEDILKRNYKFLEENIIVKEV